MGGMSAFRNSAKFFKPNNHGGNVMRKTMMKRKTKKKSNKKKRKAGQSFKRWVQIVLLDFGFCIFCVQFFCCTKLGFFLNFKEISKNCFRFVLRWITPRRWLSRSFQFTWLTHLPIMLEWISPFVNLKWEDDLLRREVLKNEHENDHSIVLSSFERNNKIDWIRVWSAKTMCNPLH